MSEYYSLAERAWLPVATRSGKRIFISLRDVVRSDVLRIDTGRPDCDISVTEFLIGLLAISSLGRDAKREWKTRFHEPPSPDEVDGAMRPFAHALVLDGPGPRFFQDYEPLDGEETAVAALLIDQPGGKTQSENADFFVKRGQVTMLSRCGAAIALLTLQTSAPGGGAGHRTSLRGGGPVTTLVIPRVAAEEPSLWQVLWANVPLDYTVDPEELPMVFPWLGRTRVSTNGNGGRSTTPEDVHKAQAFFGMPRRIRLNFEANPGSRPCDLFGMADDIVVRSYITRPYGTNYVSWSRGHPLSPYYKTKASDAEYLPLHFKSASVGYRQWTGLMLKRNDELRIRAENVATFLTERASEIGIDRRNEFKAGVLACGYAMDNMKPLDFTEAFLPIITTGSEDGDRELAGLAGHMIGAADYAAAALAQAVNTALPGNNGKSDNSSATSARNRLWSGTEDKFYGLLRKEAEGDSSGDVEMRREWLGYLRGVALQLFDEAAPVDDPESPDIKTLVQARALLLRTLNGPKFHQQAGLTPPEKSKRKAA